ncbi:heme biosynthesis protein [Salinimonas marina]|uniref:Heme biosynthesis protein n=1 Tax=Salinimonas marina TaxID=2785918 RepID=A0A7S9DXG2_9ALTE|nr:heme biosynthesis HemY N-terminal domain-containing protein [Salinimonas marina]QPG05772.1 heme biosynthesis protein [Salinimonas marina]
MRRLVIIAGLIIALLAALIVAPQVVGDKGYVLISMGSLVIEMTVVSLAISLLVAILLLWVLLKIVGVIKGWLTGSRQWFGRLSRKKRQRSFYRGVQAYAQGELAQAHKAFEQSLDGDFDGANLLLAAQVAFELGEPKRASELLDHASDYEHCAVAARVQQARMLRGEGNPEAALAVLDKLNEKQAAEKSVVQLKADCLAQAGQWQTIQTQLPQWRKTLKKDAVPLAQRAAKGKFSELASKQGANALKQYWAELPRKKRNDEAFRAAYVEQLIEQGMHQDAEECLVEWQKHGPEASLMPFFKALRMPNPASAIALLEKWIKQDDTNRQYYSLLGHVAYNANDLNLAERALLKAVKLKETREDLLLLAQISERQHDNTKALAFYKQGMVHV